MEGYLFQKLFRNIEQKIETFYVSLQIASSVSDSGLQSSKLKAQSSKPWAVTKFLVLKGGGPLFEAGLSLNLHHF